jgi:hypothetical protein
MTQKLDPPLPPHSLSPRTKLLNVNKRLRTMNPQIASTLAFHMLPHPHVYITRITRVKTPVNAPNNIDVIGHKNTVNTSYVFLDFA